MLSMSASARVLLRITAAACVCSVSASYRSAQAADVTGLPTGAFTASSAQSPASPPPANSVTAADLLSRLPSDTPEYFRESYLSLMAAPLPALVFNLGAIPPVVPQLEVDNDPSGKLGTFQPNGPTATTTNAFFQSLGTNGRSCVTCHQPPAAMGISLRNVRYRAIATAGKDPLFAPVDGANCPNQVAATDTSGSLLGGLTGKGVVDFVAAHSLLLNKGLIRIPLRVPAGAQWSKLEVVSDPTTCNLDPAYNQNVNGTRMLSMFRRPIISTNLNFKTNTLDLAPGGSPLTNIMLDGREPTLFTQATNATLGHAQALQPPTQEQLRQMVDFETNIFSAQMYDRQAGPLDAAGATGGPINLSSHGKDTPPSLPPPFPAAFDEYSAWGEAGVAKRQSIFRGQQLFLGKGGASGDRGTFTISNVAGFNDFPGIPNPLPGQSCATCHNFPHGGSDIFARSQRDIGVGGQAAAIGGPAPASDLPIFKFTCPAGSFLWNPNLTEVTTNDPGLAMQTGRCRDIGARTVPSLRALAAHEPYFSDGSAATLMDVVNFYDERFAMGLTDEEKRDLVNFINAL